LPDKSGTFDAAARPSSVVTASDGEHRKNHRGRFSIGGSPSGYIGMDDVDQLVGCLRIRIVARLALIDHVLANMVLDHFGDEAVKRAPARRRLLQNSNAFHIGFDCALDGVNLTAQALEPVEEFGFFLSRWLMLSSLDI